MVWFGFFFLPLLLRFLDLVLLLIAVDVVAIVDDNLEEIIYYFNM